MILLLSLCVSYRYLIENLYINTVLEQSNLALWCMDYLSSAPLALAALEEETMRRLKEGYFAVHDYVSVHWFEHLSLAIESHIGQESQNLIALVNQFRTFVERRWKDDLSPIPKVGSEIQQALDFFRKLPGRTKDRNERFDIEWRTAQIRGQLEAREESLIPGTMQRTLFHEMYGTRLFRCPKPECEYYFRGFDSRAQRQRHIEWHERPHLCSHSECVYHELGFPTLQYLERHLKSAHTMGQNGCSFPQDPSKRPDTLFKAAEKGNIVVLEKLLKLGSEINQTLQPKNKLTPLIVAAQHSQLEACKVLLSRGANLNFNRGNTALHEAVKKGDIEMILSFLSREDVDANQFDHYGRTPIGLAADRGTIEVMKILLKSGKVDVNKMMKSTYRSILNFASNSVDKIELLIPHVTLEVMLHAVFDIQSGQQNALKLLKTLLRSGKINVNTYYDYENKVTLLQIAICREMWTVVDYLIRHPQVDLNRSDSDDDTALSNLLKKGSFSLAKSLLAIGHVNPNSFNRKNQTPLIIAARCGHETIVNALLDHAKIDLRTRSRKNETMLDIAIREGNTAEERWLRELLASDLGPPNSPQKLTDILQRQEIKNKKRLLSVLQERDMHFGSAEGSRLSGGNLPDYHASENVQMQSYLSQPRAKRVRLTGDLPIRNIVER